MSHTPSTSGLPDYYGIRTSLVDVAAMFEGLMPYSHCVDVPETLRLMLADFFYSDVAPTTSQHLTMFDRTLALVANLFPPMEEHTTMLEVAGDVFWALGDTITRNALTIEDDINGVGTYRPHEAFYTFNPNNYDLMVYVPVRETHKLSWVAALDGRAVLVATRATWPMFLTNQLPSTPIENTGSY